MYKNVHVLCMCLSVHVCCMNVCVCGRKVQASIKSGGILTPHSSHRDEEIYGEVSFTHLFVKVYFYNKLRVGNRKLTVGFYGLEEITKPHQVGTFLVLKSSNYRKFLITGYTTHKY